MLRTGCHGCEDPHSQRDEARPLAPKWETEPRTLDSDATPLPSFFFYLGPFHTFLLPSGILFSLSPFFPIFQSQLKGCLLTRFLAPSPALAVLFLYGFLIVSFMPFTYILNSFRNYPVFICVFSICLPTS